MSHFFIFLVSFEPSALGFPSKRPTQISTSDGTTSENQGEFGVATREHWTKLLLYTTRPQSSPIQLICDTRKKRELKGDGNFLPEVLKYQNLVKRE